MGNGDQAEGPGAFYPGGCLIGISTHIGDETVMATTSAQIQQLYVAYLGRAADKAGLDYWLAATNPTDTKPAALTLDDLRSNFVNEQKEYSDVYGGLSRQDTVVKIYNNLFGRAPDAAGLTYWTTGGGATVNADQLLQAFINGAGATDSKVVANKVLVAEVYTSTAGDNFAAADAKTIISGVTDDNSTIADALDLLTDGSLGGIAVPTGVSALKADAIAQKALSDFTTSKTADLQALNKEIVKLSVTDDKADLIGDVTLSTETTYSGLSNDLKDAIATARNGLDTDALTQTVASDTTALAAARTKFITDKTYTNASDKIAAYEAAVKAVAATPKSSDNVIKQAEDTLTAYSSNPDNATVYKAALTAAGLADTTTSAQLYTALTSSTATAADVSKITTAFSSISAFSSLGAVAANDKAAAKAAADLLKADGDLGADGTAGAQWQAAYDKLAADNAKLTASKAVDAFEAKFNTIDDAHTALTENVGSTGEAVAANKALIVAADDAGVDATNEVFYFSHASHLAGQADDFTINFGAKDALYVGEGYSLNKAGTIGADGHIVGGDNNKLEVFFFKDATNGTVKAAIETGVFSSTTADLSAAAANHATDGVAVITLAGVTDISQVTFANGVISHVA